MPELFNNNTTKQTHIWYADKPLQLGGVATKISIEEFEAIFYEKKGYKITFSENIYYESKSHILETKDSSYLDEKVEKIIKNPLNEKLVICYCEEFGFGVFARERIEPGLLAIYSGKIEFNKPTEKKSLAYLVPAGEVYIDASEFCGIGAFINHGHSDVGALSKDLPNNCVEEYLKTIANPGEFDTPGVQNTLKSFEKIASKTDLVALKNTQAVKKLLLLRDEEQGSVEWQLNDSHFAIPKDRSQLAYAKAIFLLSTINGVIVPVIYLLAPVEAGEPILIDYGKKYWEELKIKPSLTMKTGQAYPDPRFRSIWSKKTTQPEKVEFEEFSNNDSYFTKP